MRGYACICIALITLSASTLAAKDFNDFRIPPAARTVVEPLDEPEMNFGLGWQFEIRGMEQPRGWFIGIGMEGLIRLDEDFWFMPSAAFFFGGSMDARRRIQSGDMEGIFGAEARFLGRADFLKWDQGTLYFGGGWSGGYFYGTRSRTNVAQGTWNFGPTWMFGVELGQRVRAAFDTGITLYFALNHGDAGWLEVGKPNGVIGVHVTLVRFSLRWYA